MSKTPPLSITDQIRAAIEAVGSQAELKRRIEALGKPIRKATLSDLYNGQRPSLEALRDIARATGCTFTITGETELGTSRASRPSEDGAGEEAPKRKARARSGA